MALSARANITALNHTLQQLITQLALYKLEIPEKVPKTEILIVIVITSTSDLQPSTAIANQLPGQ